MNPQVQVNVPCNGCTVCCKNELLILHPEMGDDVALFATMKVTNPVTGKPAFALQHKPNGDCIYLGDSGCTIHGHAPAICREFDCRRFLRSLGDRAERRRLLKIGLVSKEVFAAGTARMGTLENELEAC